MQRAREARVLPPCAQRSGTLDAGGSRARHRARPGGYGCDGAPSPPPAAAIYLRGSLADFFTDPALMLEYCHVVLQ